MGKGKRKGVPPRQGKPEGGVSPRAGRLRTTWIRTFARKLEPAKPRLRAGTQRTGARRGIYPHGFLKPHKSELQTRVERSLRDAALWDETKDRLHKPAYDLSGGQQQRLCIARALAVDPEIVLFDEPTSALDPTATLRIEELIDSLRDKVTIIIVTHNMQQAQRISDWTGFLYLGEMIEFDRTEKVFTNPGNKLTEQYITGRFG